MSSAILVTCLLQVLIFICHLLSPEQLFYMLTSFLYQLISTALLCLLYSRLRHPVRNATSSSMFSASFHFSPFLNLYILQSSLPPRPSAFLPFSLPPLPPLPLAQSSRNTRQRLALCHLSYPTPPRTPLKTPFFKPFNLSISHLFSRLASCVTCPPTASALPGARVLSGQEVTGSG